MKRVRNARSGFTLIELMVVIVILGLLVTIVAPNFQGILEGAKVDTTKASMKQVDDAIKLYRLRKGKLPDTLEELIPEFLEGPDPPKDGWKNDLRYEKKTRKEYDLVSLGADGEEGGEDEYDQDIHLADLRKSSDDTKGN